MLLTQSLTTVQSQVKGLLTCLSTALDLVGTVQGREGLLTVTTCFLSVGFKETFFGYALQMIILEESHIVLLKIMLICFGFFVVAEVTEAIEPQVFGW